MLVVVAVDQPDRPRQAAPSPVPTEPEHVSRDHGWHRLGNYLGERGKAQGKCHGLGGRTRTPAMVRLDVRRASMRSWIAAMLVGMLSCAGPGSQVASAKFASTESRRLENLRRAAKLPWLDEGACAVREAAGEWRMLAERCYHALDRSRIQLQDVDHRCPVAQTNVAAVQMIVGVCLLAALELAAEAVIVTGIVVIASALAAEIAKEEAVARVPVDTKPCLCRCLGRPDPGWNPRDPDHADPEGGKQPHPAECRALCTYRGFSSYQCR